MDLILNKDAFVGHPTIFYMFHFSFNYFNYNVWTNLII